MNLHPVNRPTKRSNRYCGPAVISALTKLPTEDCAALIRKHNGGAPVKGTSATALLRALNDCKIDHKQRTRFAKKPTLSGWLKSSKTERTAGRVYLVNAGRHWQLVSGRKFVCGITGEVVSITHDKVRRRSRVESVWELTTTGIAAPAPAPKPKRDTSQNAVRKQAKALAEKYGIKIDIERFEQDDGSSTFWVDQPDWLAGEDPIEDGHFSYCWAGVLQLVTIYAKHHPDHPEHATRESGIIFDIY